MGENHPAEPSSETMTVIIADDHEIVRDGVALILDAEPDIEVVAEVGDIESAKRRTAGLKPTVLVLDLSLGDESSIPAIPEILKRAPETRIVALTMHDDPSFAREALNMGASGFVIKDAAGRELVDAIRQVVDGGSYVHPALGARLASVQDGPPGGLTSRETEVLGLIALGYTNPEIAERLVLSVRTIETHRASIQRKLGATSRSELVRFAIENGLAAKP
ncbi:response regulator transcription factor [Thermoleophilia bacterium SCSIO 60948]|nr:response regulator transcription factor [Thermoleophilia bacterium SCSIO 60948]